MTPLQLQAFRNPKLFARTVGPEHFDRIGPWQVCLTVNA